MKRMIDQFATYDLFGRENYDYYARVTGRILRIKGEWICNLTVPFPQDGKNQAIFFIFIFCCRLSPIKPFEHFWPSHADRISTNTFPIKILFPFSFSGFPYETEKNWLQQQCDRWGISKLFQ